MRKFTKMMFTLLLLAVGVVSVKAAVKEYELDQKLTSISALSGQKFAIVNETVSKAFYGTTNQNLAFDEYEKAFLETNTAISFRLVNASGDDVAGCYYLQSVKADGTDYSIWGGGYLNSQPANQGCCFIMGLNGQNGQDGLNLAVWEITENDGTFAIKNKGTGLYLKDASPAKYEEPTYFSFYTLKEKVSEDPLASFKEDLSDAISQYGLVTDLAYTAESFAVLTQAISDGGDALEDAAATETSLTNAKTAIENAYAALAFKDGYCNLTADMFKHWDSATSPTTGSSTGCAYKLFVSTDMPYGDGNVSYLNFANLKDYEKLIIVATEGTPRFMMNRDVDNGQFNSDESQSHLIEYPKNGTWVDKYFTKVGNVYTVDLSEMLTDKGIANLNAIKGANWQNVTVSGMYLYISPDPLAVYKENLTKAIELGNMQSSFAKTTESFEVLTAAIADGETEYANADATAESLAAATKAINDAIAGLKLADGYVNLTTEMYHEWTGIGDGATIVGNGARSLALNTNLNQGDLLYGDVNVNWKHYAKLVNPKNLIILGTSGLGFGARTDRTENNESLTQLNVTLDGEGKGIIDLSEKASVRINAIKRGYDGKVGMVTDLLVEFKPRTVTVGTAGYTTFSPDLNVRATGVTAYAAKYENGKLNLTAVTEVPAGAGIIIEAAEGSYELPVIESADALDNDLLVSDGTVTGNGNIFALANGTQGVGFYKVADGQAVPAGKAYLNIAAEAREFIGFGGEATGIKMVENAAANNGEVFNLAGQRVAQPTKGLYIMNGKKVVIK